VRELREQNKDSSSHDLPKMVLGKTGDQKNPSQVVDITGDPGWIRTSDLQLRRLLLYPLSYGAAPGGL
jgi:hypothetical protein